MNDSMMLLGMSKQALVTHIEMLEKALHRIAAPFPVSQSHSDRLQEIWRIARSALDGECDAKR